MKKILSAIFIIAIVCSVNAQSGTNDPTFNPGDIGFGNGDGVYSGHINTTAIQSDGKIIIGGEFSSYNNTPINRIARLNTDGTLDTTFNPGTGPNQIVHTTSIQPDGKIIIGGSFFSYNGLPINGIARLNADGTLDTTFNNSGTGAIICATALQPDGKIIITGEFTSYNNTPVNRIARLNTDGTLDTTFNPGTGPNQIVHTTSIQPDGKIIIGGSFFSYNGLPINGIARLNADGTLDTTFNNSGTGAIICATALQPDGKIIIGGQFTSFNGIARNRIARLNPDGTLDSTFNPGSGANNTVFSIFHQPDGKIIIGGFFTSYNGTLRNYLTRLNSDGILDTTFNNSGTGANNNVNTINLQSDGKIIIGGSFTVCNGYSTNRISRMNSNGTLDLTFNPGTGANFWILSTAIQSDGKIIIGGYFTAYNGLDRKYFTRLNPNGTLDLSFNQCTWVNSTVNAIALQPDGKIIIGGSFFSYNGLLPINGIARLNTDGTLDASFNMGTGANSSVSTIALQPDGKIIIGGWFTSYNGIVRNRIARLNSDGTLDTTFSLGIGANYTVLSTAIQPDGKIIIGGAFTSYNGTEINRIARLNADGTLDTTFNTGSGANQSVENIIIQPDGKIIIAGGFIYYNGSSKIGMTRLNADGSLDVSFNNMGTGANGFIYSAALQPDGKILIGGWLTSYNGVVRNRIARLNADGTLDTIFNPEAGANHFVRSIALQSDGKVIIGGQFTAYNGTGRNRIARILDCMPSTGTHSVTACDSFTWIDGITYTSSNNSATYTLMNSTGCDSVVTLNLTIQAVDISVTVSGNSITANAIGADYQWIDCNSGNSPLQGETAQTFTATSNGNYAVIVTQYGCADTSDCVLINTIGINEISGNRIRIYPNPVSYELIIEIEGDNDQLRSFEVLNTLGQIVHKGDFIGIITLQIGHFAPGIYLIKLENENGFEFQKIMKE